MSKTWKMSSAWSSSQLLQPFLVFTDAIKLHVHITSENNFSSSYSWDIHFINNMLKRVIFGVFFSWVPVFMFFCSLCRGEFSSAEFRRCLYVPLVRTKSNAFLLWHMNHISSTRWLYSSIYLTGMFFKCGWEADLQLSNWTVSKLLHCDAKVLL